MINRVEKEKTRKDVKRNMDYDNDDIGNDEKRKIIINENDNKENEGDGDYDDEFENENNNYDINAVKEKKERNIPIKEEDDMHTHKNKNQNTDNADDDESNQTNNFFTLNEEKALKRIVELKEENRIRKDKEFTEWKERKDSQMKRDEMREVFIDRNVNECVILMYYFNCLHDEKAVLCIFSTPFLFREAGTFKQGIIF